MPPPDAVPVMVRGWTPAGVAPTPLVVVRVRALVQGVIPGVQDAGENDADAPADRPDAENETASPVHPVLVAVMMLVLLIVAPCRTDMSLSLARVKVKTGAAVIFRGNVVVLPRGPLSATVIMGGAAVTAADAETASESVISQDEPMVEGGVQDAESKDALTPVGRPVTFLATKETGDGAPELVVTCMVWLSVAPRRMETLPPLESV